MLALTWGTLLKRETSLKIGIAAKRKLAGWDDDCRFNALSI